MNHQDKKKQEKMYNKHYIYRCRSAANIPPAWETGNTPFDVAISGQQTKT